MSDYPKVDYPTIIKGWVQGEKLRLEALDGSEMILVPIDAGRFGDSLSYYEGAFHFNQFGPVSIDQKTWGVTHLQKYCQKGQGGLLIADPSCWHRWWTIKSQEKDDKGNWIPNSERVIYFRKPGIKWLGIESWRWQPNPEDKEKWQFTKGYFNLSQHWD